MISLSAYGNSTEYDLPVQGQNTQRVLDQWYNDRKLRELVPPDLAHGHDLYPLPWPIKPPKPEIGKLYFPGFGATRFAFATYVIDHYSLGKLRTDLGDSNKVTLRLRDDPDDELESGRLFTMYLVAARPLVNPDAATPAVTEPDVDDGYVVTLVDVRYYWQYQQGTTGDAGSWTQLMTQLCTQLGGGTPSYDTISGSYGSPTNARWTQNAISGKSTAAVFDAAAAQVGMRVVVDNLGAVSVLGPTTANFGAVTSFHTTNVDRLHFGGLIAAADNVKGVPAKVTAVASPGNTADVTLASLALPGYGNGVANAAVVAWLDATASATQWATDWYDWQDVPLDAVYVGIADAFVFNGFVGHYEIYHDEHTAWTRVARPPVNYSSLTSATAAGDSSFLVQLVGKSYADAAGCTGEITYTWVRVRDKSSPCTVTYDYGDVTTPTCGGPNCLPLYHARNLDMPVWFGGTDDATDCSPTIPTGTVLMKSVFRARVSQNGNRLIIEDHPWVDLFRRTGITDSDGEQAYLRYFDQNDATWKDGIEVRLVEAG